MRGQEGVWGFLTLQQPQTQEYVSGEIRWSRFLKELREALGVSGMSSTSSMWDLAGRALDSESSVSL